MSNKLFRIILLGAPASGKGTISRLIMSKWEFEHIAPGDILRLNVKNRTALGIKVERFLNEGKLVPDLLIINCLKEYLGHLSNKSLLFDGFPRTVFQAQQLSTLVNNNSKENIFETVLNIVVPHDIIVERAKGRWVHLQSGRIYNIGFKPPKVAGLDDVTGEKLVQRDDDKPEIVRKRLQQYDEVIEPVINFYKQLETLTTFKGNTTAEIWQKIETFLLEKIHK